MYINVIVPLALKGVLTYSVPPEIEGVPQVGTRVLVQIGKKKIYTGIICRLDVLPDNDITIKPILCILDNKPIISSLQLRFWTWIADYYLCTIGEVCKAALPTALKLESETRVAVNDEFIADSPLPSVQQQILDLLGDGKQHDISELARKIDIKSIIRHINKLIDAGAVIVEEQVSEKYKPKFQAYVTLHPDISSPELLQQSLSALHRAPKQEKLFLTYLQLSDFEETGEPLEINQSDLLAAAESSVLILKQLVDKHVLQSVRKAVDRLPLKHADGRMSLLLNEAQSQAYTSIINQWREKNVVLLHGVTSSGKTEVYIKLIEKVISEGKHVLYLVPEIALTTQLTDRLRAVFGDRLGVYHSKFSDAERAETYRNLLNNQRYDVLLGVRSSVFLPFNNLGLIIVDEEHDSSYKQQDPAPRYHARNAAIVLATLHGAKVLLGTATPAVETYYNAVNQKYGLVQLTQRYKNIRMPEVQLVDLRESYRRKEIEGHFSDLLVNKIALAIDNKKQVILFQNRRGFAPYLCCSACGYVPKCVNCDVALTVHKKRNILSCHYCGYSITLPDKCPSCGQQTLKNYGFGTERIEEEISQLFPNSVVKRMDLDTTRSKHSYESIIDDFARHKIDILVGTQMVTKGLHFDDVSLVAVLNADNLMNVPDFRSYERAYQLLEQVSGRAGRKTEQGEVIIQTRQPDEMMLQYVKNHDFIGFYNSQIAERQTFRYPPYYRLMQIVLKHRDETKVRYIADKLQQLLAQVFGRRVSVVIVPIVAWIQNQHIRQIMLRVESNASFPKAKQLLMEQISAVTQLPDGKTTSIYVDVDPV